MGSLGAYFEMGGYAWFVWPAYALAALGLVGVAWQSYRGWRARESEFAALKAHGDDEVNP
jgi:heme exporter protein D